jgi:hypothetical protein
MPEKQGFLQRFPAPLPVLCRAFRPSGEGPVMTAGARPASSEYYTKDCVIFRTHRVPQIIPGPRTAGHHDRRPDRAKARRNARIPTAPTETAMSMNIVPLAFAVNRLNGIDRVERRLDSEAALFGEIRELLKRHGAEKKYGLALLHKHFDLADDEVLMEYTDLKTRTLITRPAHRSAVTAANAIETIWSLETGNMTTACVGFCYYYPSTGEHIKKHE